MAEIKKIPVNSSNIESIGFEEDLNTSPPAGTLRIWFKSGGAYDYDKVEVREFEALQNAKSIDSYFASNIKGKYAYKKV